jgi:hypothetical protein
VSWIDILNGYQFRYRSLAVEPELKARADQALREIAAMPRQAVDPRSFAPVAADPGAARPPLIR